MKSILDTNFTLSIYPHILYPFLHTSSFLRKARVSETLWARETAADQGAGRSRAFHRPRVATESPGSPWCPQRRRGVAGVGVRSSVGRISCVGETGGDHLQLKFI